MTAPLTLIFAHRESSIFLMADGTELTFTQLGTSIRSKHYGWASDVNDPRITLEAFLKWEGTTEALASRFLMPDWSEHNAKAHLEYLIRLATKHGMSEVAADLAHQLETEEAYESLTDWFRNVVTISQPLVEDGHLDEDDDLLPEPGLNAEELALFRATFDLFREHFQRRFVLTDEGPKARMVMV